MVLYRRNYVACGGFFFTVSLRDRSSDLLVRHGDLLRAAVAEVKQALPFEIVAMVEMPDHLHTVWKLPTNDGEFSGRGRSRRALCAR